MVDVRRFYIPDIFCVMSGKRMVVSIAFSRKGALAIMCRQYVVQFQLGTTRLLRFIDFLLAVERMQQVMDATTLYCTVSCHSKMAGCTIKFCVLSCKMQINNITTQSLYCSNYMYFWNSSVYTYTFILQ